MESKDFITLPYTQTIAPLGKIKIEYLPEGIKRIKAYVIGEHIRNDAQTGMAIEGSKYMKPMFGFTRKFGNLFPQQVGTNWVAMVVPKIGSYLARKVDKDKKTTVVYWATGSRGTEIQMVGSLSAYQIEQYQFAGPMKFGSEARLLPAVRYFVENYADAKWGMYVFFTQGIISDLKEVKEYTIQLAEEISSGLRNDLKMVLIGIGKKVNKPHLEMLDNLDIGAKVDLWDYRIASDMIDVMEIFTELSDINTIVSPLGRVLDRDGNVIVDYSTKGVPALMIFTLPRRDKSFKLELPGKTIIQPIP
jgi:hypothetical protein